MWTVLRGHGDAENKKINVAALKTYSTFFFAATAPRAEGGAVVENLYF